jgi:hypothetical protein
MAERPAPYFLRWRLLPAFGAGFAYTGRLASLSHETSAGYLYPVWLFESCFGKKLVRKIGVAQLTLAHRVDHYRRSNFGE